jgi:hypothetical protein
MWESVDVNDNADANVAAALEAAAETMVQYVQ